MTEIDVPYESQVVTSDIIVCTDEGSSSSLLSSSSSSTNHLAGSPAIDRHNPIITDSRRISKPTLPSSPQPRTPLPFSPKPPIKNQKKASKAGDGTKKKHSKKQTEDKKRTNGVEPSECGGATIKKGWSCTKPSDFINPPASSRYLLGDNASAFLNVLSDFDPVLNLVSPESSNSVVAVKTEESSASKSSSSDQVVVLRVSLHCRGCERKMRKHISRMKGVTSFNIDFAAKEVTVVGNVTPLDVIASVSKVKNAQLWTPPPLCSEAKKQKGVHQ